MSKIIFTFAILSIILSSIARTTADQPLVQTFQIQEEVVYEHLSTILESAMQLAMEDSDFKSLSNVNGSDSIKTKKGILTVAMTNFLAFNPSKLNPEFLDSNLETFKTRIVTIFEETCLNTVTVNSTASDANQPDFDKIEEDLKAVMAGYYFAVKKENKFDLNFKVDWAFAEIQKLILAQMMTKMRAMQAEFANAMGAMINARFTEFKARFSLNYNHISLVFLSFRSYAMEILIDQLRSFYVNVAENPNTIIAQNAKKDFERTIAMWSLTYKLCEEECTDEQLENLTPSFLEEMVDLRIKNNRKIVDNKVSLTLFSKFLGFIMQNQFKNGTQEDESATMTQQYAMFVYRLFYSKSAQFMNRQLSTFMRDVYTKNGLNYLHPEASLEDENAEEYAFQKEANKRYVIDLILHLDIPEFKDGDVQNTDAMRTQPITFSEDEVTLLVQNAASMFSFDLDLMSTETIILNWFMSYNDEKTFDDYLTMYHYLFRFRNTYIGEQPGQDLDTWIDNFMFEELTDSAEDVKEKEFRKSMYWLMKITNAVNVLSGDDYNESNKQDLDEQTLNDVMFYFRRIIARDEFKVLKQTMLLIFNYYNDGVLSTDLEEDKYLIGSYRFIIECEKLPEILKTQIKITNVIFKDDEDVLDTNTTTNPSKKNLDDGNNSETSVEIIETTSSNSSNLSSFSNKSSEHVIAKKSEKSASQKSSVKNNSETTEEVIEVTSENSSLVSNNNSEDPVNKSIKSESSFVEVHSESNQSTSKKNNVVPVVVPVVINNPSTHTPDIESEHSNITIINVIEKVLNNKTKSNKTSEVSVHTVETTSDIDEDSHSTNTTPIVNQKSHISETSSHVSVIKEQEHIKIDTTKITDDESISSHSSAFKDSESVNSSVVDVKIEKSLKTKESSENSSENSFKRQDTQILDDNDKNIVVPREHSSTSSVKTENSSENSFKRQDTQILDDNDKNIVVPHKHDDSSNSSLKTEESSENSFKRQDTQVLDDNNENIHVPHKHDDSSTSSLKTEESSENSFKRQDTQILDENDKNIHVPHKHDDSSTSSLKTEESSENKSERSNKTPAVVVVDQNEDNKSTNSSVKTNNVSEDSSRKSEKPIQRQDTQILDENDKNIVVPREHSSNSSLKTDKTSIKSEDDENNSAMNKKKNDENSSQSFDQESIPDSIHIKDSSKNSSQKSSQKSTHTNVVIIADKSNVSDDDEDNKSHVSVKSNKSIILPVVVPINTSTKTEESSESSSMVSVSSNNSNVNNKSNKSQEHPLINNKSENTDLQSESSNSSESNVLDTNVVLPVTEDKDVKRHNLVYEVAGKITPAQRKAFEFSDDVFAEIKNMQLQTDEYGNEVEYVYVQIVRKDSDCYEELMKYK